MRFIKDKKELDSATVQALIKEDPSYEIWDMDSRIIFINNEINHSLTELYKLFYKWSYEDKDIDPNNRKPIKIFIHCQGGDSDCATALVDIMNSMITPIWTINLGVCYSAALYIFAAGFKRFALQNSSFMVHDGALEMSMDFQKIKAYADHFEELTDRLNEQLSWSSKIEHDELKAKGAEDWYFFADEAYKLGVVDEIVEDFESLCE